MTAHYTEGFGGGGDKYATGAKTMIRLTEEGTTTGTWNVCSIHGCGKVQELTHELKHYQCDILGLARSDGQVLEKVLQMRNTLKVA